MVNVIKEALFIPDELRKRIDFICKFNNSKPKYFNASLKRIQRNNLIYHEPHRIEINGISYLFFNNSDDIYIDKLNAKLTFKDLENISKQKK